MRGFPRRLFSDSGNKTRSQPRFFLHGATEDATIPFNRSIRNDGFQRGYDVGEEADG
jgi:hypothetical protein